VPRYLQIAFNLPLQQTFTYLDLDDEATRPGVRVVAPFGRRRVTGFVVDTPMGAPGATKRSAPGSGSIVASCGAARSSASPV